MAVATAGSSTKRALLRTLGVQTVVSSRDTIFAEESATEVRLTTTRLQHHQHAALLNLLFFQKAYLNGA